MGFKDMLGLVKAKIQYATGNSYQKKGLKKKIDYYENTKGMSAEERADFIKKQMKEENERAEYIRLKNIEDINKTSEKYNFATGDEIAEMSDEKFNRYIKTTTNKWEGRLSYGTDELVMNKIVREKYNINSISFDDVMDAYRVNVPRKRGDEQDSTTYIIGDLTILNEIGEPMFDARDRDMSNIDKAMTLILNEYGQRDTVMLYQILKEMYRGNKLELEEINYERSKEKS